MAPIRSRKSQTKRTRPYINRARHYTPPPELHHSEALKHVETPSRCAVIICRLLEQENIRIPEPVLFKITGVPPRTRTRILRSKQVRTLHNIPDSGPDLRGQKRAITHQDTTAVALHLDDPKTDFEDRSAPWRDIARDSGVDLPNTTHFKPAGERLIEPESIRKACKEDYGIFNAVAEEEKELTRTQTRNRLDHCNIQLGIGESLTGLRPHSKHWFTVAFCDEFHFGIGPQVTKRIKRLPGKENRHAPHNVHHKKVTAKDTKAKAREEEHLELLSLFVVIGYNYRKVVEYNVPNSVGKMTTKAYTEQVLPEIMSDLKEKGLALYQDADSAHTSQGTIKWAKKHGVELIQGPGVSPDFSILESMAHPLKQRFHAERCTTQKAAKERFMRVFYHEMDQKKIQEMYKWYTKRLHECRRREGQMTRY